MAGRSGLGPRGAGWAREAASHWVHEAEIVDEEALALAAGTPALLSRAEAADVIEVLDTVAAASSPGPGRERVQELALLLRERLRRHTD